MKIIVTIYKYVRSEYIIQLLRTYTLKVNQFLYFIKYIGDKVYIRHLQKETSLLNSRKLQPCYC